MEKIIKDILSVKVIICFFLLKDVVFSYILWVIYQRTKITHYKIVGVDREKAVKILFQKKNAERGKK